MRRFVLALLFLVPAASAWAADTYQVGIDLDPGTAGGCDFNLMGAEANATDVDLLLELTVIAGAPPMVGGSQLRTCNVGLNIFENPMAVGPVPWPVGVGVGISGPGGAGNVIEAIVPESFLANAPQVRLVVLAVADGGSVDVLSTSDGTPSGSPIIASLPIAAPLLSPLALLMLSFLLLAIGWLLSKRWGHQVGLMLILCVIAAAPGVAYALLISLDGMVLDWATLTPVAIDSDNDSTPAETNAEILALFATSGGGNLSLRIDLMQHVNVPPTVDAISLSPSPADEGDTLTCAVSGSDLDGDPVTFAYGWQVNGVPNSQTSSSLTGLFFNKGDAVICIATPNDGTVDGIPVSSNLVTIQNTAPSLGGVSLTPLVATKASTLTCTPSGIFDIDGDSVTVSYAWRINGAIFGGATTSSLGSAFFQRGDAIVCEATPTDGFDAGSTTISNVLVIQNSPPTLSSVSISPALPNDASTLSCLPAGLNDLDGDSVTISYAWEVNSALIGATTSSLSPTLSNQGDTVRCIATPFDGLDAGPPVLSPVVTIQ